MKAFPARWGPQPSYKFINGSYIYNPYKWPFINGPTGVNGLTPISGVIP